MLYPNKPFDPHESVSFIDIRGVIMPEIELLYARAQSGGLWLSGPSRFLELLSRYGFVSIVPQCKEGRIVSYILESHHFIYLCHLTPVGDFTLVLRYRSITDGKVFHSEYRLKSSVSYHEYILEEIFFRLILEMGKIMDPIFYDDDIKILISHRLLPLDVNK